MLGLRVDVKRAATPTQLQVITMLPYHFGEGPSETAESYVFSRVRDFPIRAAFETPARRVRIGGPVVGCIEPTSGDASSAQLVGWDVTPMLNWQLTSDVSGNFVFPAKNGSPH